MKSLNVGFARTVITPKLGVRLGGYGIAERPTESVHDNLHSSALVLKQEDVFCALISLDWVCITAEVAARAKKAISDKIAIPEDNIIICTTHTHTAPETMGIAGSGELDMEYIDFVMPEIIESAVQAAKKLAPAKLGVASVKSRVGVNRRTVKENGEVCLDGNVDGNYDPNMTVMRFVGTDEIPIVTLIHYGTHPTAWGAVRIVSRDWPGIMLSRLEKQTGSPAMFVNGAIGDVGPRMNCAVGEGRFSAGSGDGLESVLEVGYRAATDALQCFFAINAFDKSPHLQAAIADMEIPVKPLPPLDEVESKLRELEKFKDAWGGEKCQYEYYSRVRKAYDVPPRKTITIESRIIAVGPVAFITLPGEPFSSISLRLREASPFPYTLLVSNANGRLAYIPDFESRKIGGYEVFMESSVHTYLPVENSDSAIVGQGVEKLKSLHAPK